MRHVARLGTISIALAVGVLAAAVPARAVDPSASTTAWKRPRR